MKIAVTAISLLLSLIVPGNSYPQQSRASRVPIASVNVAETPPMGWNSWDSYGLTINEENFRANVLVQASRLKPFGWTYAVIDEGWFLHNPEDRPHPELLQYELDPFGRYIPVPARFPSATISSSASAEASQNNGFAEIGRWVHAQGLKFGIHIVRGIPRESVRRNLPIENSQFHAFDVADMTDACPWDPTNWGVKDDAAGQAWYDSLLRQYATWGVDFLKVDCVADHPYKLSEIKQIRLAIRRSGRPIILSLSPGPTALTHAAEVGSLAEMWRISNDIWDVWQSDEATFPSVKSQFERLAAWAAYAQPGKWPDADMLPLGELRPKPDVGPGPRKTRLTLEEQRTMLTLWSMARSPLILGANLTMLDAETLKLITNEGILRIDQTATASRQAWRTGDLIAWTADLPEGEHALAVFNLGDVSIRVTEKLTTFGLAAGAWHTHALWSSRTEAAMIAVDSTIPPHGCLLLLLNRQ